MIVSPTIYNADGELMAPTELDVKRHRPLPGGMPTLDAGYYHAFKFEGRTKSEFDAKVMRFVASMREVPGYMLLSAREYTVEMGAFKRLGLEVLYAVESAERPTRPARRSSANDSAAPNILSVISRG